MSALDDLIAAVEAPDTNWYHFPELCENAFGECARTESIRSAYMGSLDAGLGLHEALLPGCSWDIWRTLDHLPDGMSRTIYGCNLPMADTEYCDNPARSWLLAILRALKAQEGRE